MGAGPATIITNDINRVAVIQKMGAGPLGCPCGATGEMRSPGSWVPPFLSASRGETRRGQGPALPSCASPHAPQGAELGSRLTEAPRPCP